MKTDFHLSMAEATRLTREGRLTDAVDMIQSLLGGRQPAAEDVVALSDGVIIDITPTEVAREARPTRPATAHEADPAPVEARSIFVKKSYRSASGNLTYWLYVPTKETVGKPLVVMLHGCTQSAEDFARGTRMNQLADELGFVVAYPEQDRTANAQKCWNWFKPGDQQRNRGEPALIAGVTHEIVTELNLDSSRVFVAGLSAGGAAAAIMAAVYPDVYAAVGIHSGLCCGSARDLPSALMAMNGQGSSQPPRAQRFVPVITFHGDRDTTVQEVNSRRIIAAASASAGSNLKTEVEERTSRNGHACTRQVSSDTSGRVVIEQWTIHGAGHAWAGGNASGSYTDPAGPDASREMARFFLASGG